MPQKNIFNCGSVRAPTRTVYIPLASELLFFPLPLPPRRAEVVAVGTAPPVVRSVSVIGVIIAWDDGHETGLPLCDLSALGTGGGDLGQLLTEGGYLAARPVRDEHAAL